MFEGTANRRRQLGTSRRFPRAGRINHCKEANYFSHGEHGRRNRLDVTPVNGTSHLLSLNLLGTECTALPELPVIIDILHGTQRSPAKSDDGETRK